MTDKPNKESKVIDTALGATSGAALGTAAGTTVSILGAGLGGAILFPGIGLIAGALLGGMGAAALSAKKSPIGGMGAAALSAIGIPITPANWARIHAHAWLDPTFREMLEKNPARAVEEFAHHFPFPPYDKLFDLDVVGILFSDISTSELTEIVARGTRNGVPFSAQLRTDFQAD